MIEGKNTVTTKSANTLLNLRPTNLFFSSILIHSIGPDDQVILTTDNNVSQDPKTKKWIEGAELSPLGGAGEGCNAGTEPDQELIPKRVIRFDRQNLQPIEQDSYDKEGNIETITTLWTAPDLRQREVSRHDHHKAAAGGIPDRVDPSEAGRQPAVEG